MESFQFNQQYLSTFSSVAIIAPLYLCIVYGIEKVIKKPFSLKYIVIAHNATISFFSGVLMVLLIHELVSLSIQYGFWSVFCDARRQYVQGRLIFYYYINYLFKYVELLDTLFLALRKKPMAFLHTYHHSATLFLCWAQLKLESSVQWVPILINLLVHVFMYAYYCLYELKMTVWWKKYLTLGQISQFVTGMLICVGGVLPRVLHDFVYQSYSKCNTGYISSFLGFFVLTSYLVLFIQLYRSEGYKKKLK